MLAHLTLDDVGAVSPSYQASNGRVFYVQANSDVVGHGVLLAGR